MTGGENKTVFYQQMTSQ